MHEIPSTSCVEKSKKLDNKSAVVLQNVSVSGTNALQCLNDSSKRSIRIEVIIESEDESGVNDDWSVDNNDFIENNTSDKNDEKNDFNVNDTANALKRALKAEKHQIGQNIQEEIMFSEKNILPSEDIDIKIRFLDEEDCDEVSNKKEIMDVEDHEFLQCKTCMSIFMDKKELVAHKEQHHADAELIFFVCNNCSATFSEKAEMQEHIRAMHGHSNNSHEFEKLISEINKKKESKQREKIQEHDNILKWEDKEDLITKKIQVRQCKICFNFTKDSNDLRCCYCKIRNLQRCTICNNGRVYKKRTYRVHMTEVHGVGRFPCPKCKEVFKCKRYMNQHIKVVHYGCRRGRPALNKGKNGLKTSKDANRLGQHENASPDQSVVCPICHSKLSSASYLKTHMLRLHYDGEKRFGCDVCHKVFKCPKYLADHKKYYHSEESLFCKKCSRKFCTRYYLKHHLLNCTSTQKNDIVKEITQDSNKVIVIN